METLPRTVARVETKTHLGPDAQVDDKNLIISPGQPELTDRLPRPSAISTAASSATSPARPGCSTADGAPGAWLTQGKKLSGNYRGDYRQTRTDCHCCNAFIVVLFPR
jgi:hypothetical protein